MAFRDHGGSVGTSASRKRHFLFMKDAAKILVERPTPPS
jgi:hypothetical protein